MNLTDQDTRAAEACAESIDWNGLGPGAISFMPMAINQFLNGIAYRDQNPPAEVLALIQALEVIASYYPDGCARADARSASARDALEAWRKRGGLKELEKIEGGM